MNNEDKINSKKTKEKKYSLNEILKEEQIFENKNKSEKISLVDDEIDDKKNIIDKSGDEKIIKPEKIDNKIEPIIWKNWDIPNEIKANLKYDKKDKIKVEDKHKKRKDKHLDDPKDYFDNTPSEIRENTQGKYNTIEDLKKIIDSYRPTNTSALTKKFEKLGKTLGVLLTAVPFYGLHRLLNVRKRTVPQGKFQIVNKGGIFTTILPEGNHTLLSPFDKYGKMLDKDDESQSIRPIGDNIKIVQVKPNHLGVARLVSKMVIKQKDAHGKESEVTLGEAGDALLLYQGNYCFREDEFCSFQVYNFNDDKELVFDPNTNPNKEDPLAIMTVKGDKLGCAYNIDDGEYKLFEKGKRKIFDKKEWREFQLKNITDRFTIGPWLFLKVTEGQHVCVHKKDGGYQVISEPGRYKLHNQTWDHNKIEIKNKDINVEFEKFWIFSPKHNHYSVVEDKFGKYHTLEPGKKYFLDKAKFKKPIEKDKKDLPRDLMIELGDRTIISPTNNVLMGAWNIKTGKFEIFENLEKALELPKDIYPVVEKINKVVMDEDTGKPITKPQVFGPYKTINITAGKLGIISKEDGELELIKPGFHKFKGTSLIREALPNRPIIIPIDLKSFYTRNRFDLSGKFDIQFEIKDHKKLSNKLEVDKIKFSQLKSNLNKFIQGKLSQILRTFEHYQLTNIVGHEKEDIQSNYKKVTDKLSVELQDYSERSGLGIKFGQAKLASDIIINDLQIRKNYIDMEKCKLQTESKKAINNAREEQNKSTYEVETKELQRKKDIESKQVEVSANKLKLEQDTKIKLEKARLQAKIEREKLDLQAEENKKEISHTSKLKREKNEKTLKLEIRINEIKVEKEDLKFSEEKRLKTAEIDKKEKVLKSKAEAEQLEIKSKSAANQQKIKELVALEIKEKQAMVEANSIKTLAKAKKEQTDAKVYEIEKTGTAEAKKLELINKAKEKMPKLEYELKLAEIKSKGEVAKGIFGNGILLDERQKIIGDIADKILPELQIGGIGGKNFLTTFEGFKNSQNKKIVKKSNSSSVNNKYKKT